MSYLKDSPGSQQSNTVPERGMRLALIVDNRAVGLWQAECLKRLGGSEVTLVLNCTNTRTKKRPFKHALYYLLNLVAIQNSQQRRLALDLSQLGQPRVINFESTSRGLWQLLPEDVLDRIRRAEVDAIIKFGMSLLVVPEDLSIPILSFHHGDPELYRGRPAGFYELLHGERTMGVIVQVISNVLDAGRVVAFGELPLRRHSYRKTLIEAFRLSPLLFEKALKSIPAHRYLSKSTSGQNYRLPSNMTVVKFMCMLWLRKLQRILYGASVEKRWRVSTAKEPEDGALPEDETALFRDEYVVPVQSAYSFYADPFFISRNAIVVEALCKRTGKGILLLVEREGQSALTADDRHCSYPAVYREGEEPPLLLPEISSWSTPHLFRIESSRLVSIGAIYIEGSPRVVDPTLFSDKGIFYLFGNDTRHGTHVLSLWSSHALLGPYRNHPRSPIHISPRGGRMAGALIRVQSGLYRLGQNNVERYGDGIIIFKLNKITEMEYDEEPIQELRFSERRGPHTLNIEDGKYCFDWYDERFNLGAGYRRILGRVGVRRKSR